MNTVAIELNCRILSGGPSVIILLGQRCGAYVGGGADGGGGIVAEACCGLQYLATKGNGRLFAVALASGLILCIRDL